MNIWPVHLWRVRWSAVWRHLVIEKYGVGKKGFTPEALKEILYQSAYDLDEYNPRYAGQLGHGCVDATAALKIDVSNLHPFIIEVQSGN